jgi:hypothetical protein
LHTKSAGQLPVQVDAADVASGHQSRTQQLRRDIVSA